MDKKSIPELDKLFLEIGTYRKSDELNKLFEFIKRFPKIAPYNAMLIHIQKPGSQYYKADRGSSNVGFSALRATQEVMG